MDDKTKKLVEALQRIANLHQMTFEATSTGGMLPDFEHQKIAKQALAAFEPEQEWEYVLPEKRPNGFISRFDEIVNNYAEDVFDDDETYNALRELTKRPKGREWWLVEQSRTEFSITFDAYDVLPDDAEAVHVREVLP